VIIVAPKKVEIIEKLNMKNKVNEDKFETNSSKDLLTNH